jgi:Raf kinase inhibitor-like YbhB/YbcL family protein
MANVFRGRAPVWLCAVALLGAGAVAGTAGTALAANSTVTHRVSQAGHLRPFTVFSPNFRDGGFLPPSAELGGPVGQGVCTGKNLAPALRWFNLPAGTKSFTLTITDPDAPVAGGFHHWVVYNIPRSHPFLAGHGHNPFSEGTNDFGHVGYDGSCPPPTGQPHHYVFTVYALHVGHIGGVHLTYGQLIKKIARDVVGATSIIGKFSLPLPH